MYIDISEAVKEELDNRIENATKYNGDIYRLTETIDTVMTYDNHGDIVKYVDEEVKTLKDMKVVFIALINGLNREA